MDALGLQVDALSGANQAQAVLLTPAHQTPTGVVLAPGRRQELVGWAAGTGGVIIEDDYDAEFRYDRQPVGSLQGLAPDHVVTMGSVSKSLAPGLRLGWIVCPPHLIEAVAAEKAVADRGSPVLEQLALARLIESGRHDRHMRRMRTVYAARRQGLVQALARHAPRVRLGGLAAGFHAVARLPEPATRARGRRRRPRSRRRPLRDEPLSRRRRQRAGRAGDRVRQRHRGRHRAGRLIDRRSAERGSGGTEPTGASP